MTTLLFVRHGESEGNQRAIFVGSSNLPLTERGRIQAEKTALWLDRYPEIEAVYSSDLSRAVQTAQPLAGRRSLPIQTDPGLREIDGGVWEMKPFRDLAGLYPSEFSDWSERMDVCRCPGGESIAELQARVLGTVLRICSAHPDGTVALFTHATPIRTQKCVWNGWPLNKIMTYSWVPNASVSVVTFDGASWKLLLDGYDGHLAGLHTELPREI